MTRIAFIGLGNMGGGMAANQARAQHHVRAFDLSAAAVERGGVSLGVPGHSVGSWEGARSIPQPCRERSGPLIFRDFAASLKPFLEAGSKHLHPIGKYCTGAGDQELRNIVVLPNQYDLPTPGVTYC